MRDMRDLAWAEGQRDGGKVCDDDHDGDRWKGIIFVLE